MVAVAPATTGLSKFRIQGIKMADAIRELLEEKFGNIEE